MRRKKSLTQNYYALAILILGLMSVSSILGVIVLTAMGVDPPSVLEHLIFTAAGALGGLLAPRGDLKTDLENQIQQLDEDEIQLVGDHRTKTLIADALRDVVNQTETESESDK